MQNVRIREVEYEDFFIGLHDVLNTLSPTKRIWEDWAEVLDHRERNNVKTFVAYICDESNYKHRIIGTASLLIEHKITHGHSCCGHIEDVAVLPEFQKDGIGKLLINYAVQYAAGYGCRKVVLGCSDEVKGFYEKLGFKHVGNLMRIDLID